MNKKEELEITFDVTTIDHLGVKLYSTIPPMIAELVSNAWDADAHVVKITFMENPKSILVQDDGCGMSFEELNTKFLKIGRNRRVETNTDKTVGGRFVLGKKGLGKLSMFGIGKKITITTVKDGLKNSFSMNYEDIKRVENKEHYKPSIINFNISTVESTGTSIFIENLARKSSFNIDSIRQGLLSRFKIFSKDFVIEINEDPSKRIDKNEYDFKNCQFSWKFPDDFTEDKMNFEGLYDFAVQKKITGEIHTAETPLTKEKQGIILFSRNKLVQEKNPFSSRGNDNFFQYMCGQFSVDFIDSSFEIDNCSTDRKSLAWDTYENDELEKLKQFLEKAVSITQKKWREKRKENKEEKIRKKGVEIQKWLETLSSLERPLAKKLVNAILENEDISDDAAKSYILSIQEMYSFEGFKEFSQRLADMAALDSENAIKLLTDWSEIEAKEYAKISLGRVKAIEQFDRYVKTNASENKVIQKFLEEFPWLLDPKMSKFEREITFSRVLKQNFNDDFLPEHDRRIDFLCTNDAGIVHVIELKRPNIRLTSKQLQQITEYTEFIEKHYPNSVKEVYGYLISDNMTCEPGAERMRKALETEHIFVKSYSDLLAAARQYHKELYDSYEKIKVAKH